MVSQLPPVMVNMNPSAEMVDLDSLVVLHRNTPAAVSQSTVVPHLVLLWLMTLDVLGIPPPLSELVHHQVVVLSSQQLVLPDLELLGWSAATTGPHDAV